MDEVPGSWVRALLLRSEGSDGQAEEPWEEEEEEEAEEAFEAEFEEPREPRALEIESKLDSSLDDILKSEIEERMKSNTEEATDSRSETRVALVHRGQRLEDRDVKVLATDLLEDTRCKFEFREIDFSQNQLSALGLASVVDICKKAGSHLKVVKLFRNCIGDDCVEAFADMVEFCPDLKEVHLSHNKLSNEGVMGLAKATYQRRRPGAPPLWLRIEQNPGIVEPSELLHRLEMEYRVCPRRPACTQFHCAAGSMLHVPFLDKTLLERKDKIEKARRSRSRSPRRAELARRPDVSRSSRRRSQSRQSCPSRGEVSGSVRLAPARHPRRSRSRSRSHRRSPRPPLSRHRHRRAEVRSSPLPRRRREAGQAVVKHTQAVPRSSPLPRRRRQEEAQVPAGDDDDLQQRLDRLLKML